jgi:hypothetical protein
VGSTIGDSPELIVKLLIYALKYGNAIAGALILTKPDSLKLSSISSSVENLAANSTVKLKSSPVSSRLNIIKNSLVPKSEKAGVNENLKVLSPVFSFNSKDNLVTLVSEKEMFIYAAKTSVY